MIDDWEAWNSNLHCKCCFYKKSWGYPRRYIQGHLRTVTPTTFSSQQARPFTERLILFSAELTLKPFRPSSAPSRALAQTLESLIPVKSKKKKKINEKMWSFCFAWSCLSSGYICSQKPWTGAFWSTSQMTRLLMGAGQCHIWFHAYSWREPHSWDHALWGEKLKGSVPPTPGMKNVIVEMGTLAGKV